MNRRKFLQQLAVGTVAITAYYPLTQMATGNGTPRKRRHLINIIRGGGFDTFWHHNSMAPSQLRSSAYPAEEQGTTTPSNPASRNIQRIGPGISDYLTIREAEDPARFYQSPGGGTHYFGSAFQQLFRDTHFRDGNPLLGKMQVWKGMGSSCRHELDNPILLHGVASTYALSFSALISERLAKDSARTLHYAVLHDNPSQAFLNFALNTGYQSPSCIPGIAGLTNLTGSDPHDFHSVTRRNLVSTSIRNLSDSIFSNRFKLRSTIANLGVFRNSFDASTKVAGSHLDQDIELLYSRNRFRNQIYTEAAKFFGVSNSSGAIYNALVILGGQDGMGSGQAYIDLFRAGYTYAAANPVPDLTSYRMRKESGQDVSLDEVTLRAQMSANINSQSLNSYYPDLIDRFALAAYLVRQNLSAVVDFREGVGMGVIDDAHHNVLPGLAKEMVFFAGFKELMVYLNEFPEANPGETLLDATH